MNKTFEEKLEDYIWGRTRSDDYLRRVAKGDQVTCESILKQVSQIDDTLNRQLRKGVEDNLSRLLEQTTALEALDKTQQNVHNEMKDVFDNCDRFAKNLNNLLSKYSMETRKLESIVKMRNLAEDAMRCEDLIASFNKRTELVKRSEIVCELRGIVDDCPELTQITWLKETVTEKLKAAEYQVRHSAAGDLRRALISLNASLVASSTRALTNIGFLEDELDALLLSSASEVDVMLSELSTTADYSRSLPSCVNLINNQLEQCVLLGSSYVSKFSEKLARIIRARIPLDAPYTLRLVQQMGRVLQSRPECSLGPLDDAMRPLKASLLSHSLKRLHDIIENHDFSAIHSNSFVDNLNSAMEEELGKVEWDTDLKEEMFRNIRKCIEMVAKRFEIETKLEPENLLFGERLNAAQLTNYRLLLSAHTLLVRWPAHSAPLISYHTEVVDTIFVAVKAGISAILRTMEHDPKCKDVSPFMTELCSYLNRVMLHFSHMGTSLSQSPLQATIVDYIIDRFILYASAIRPFSVEVRKQIITDFNRLMLSLNDFGSSSKYPSVEKLARLFDEPTKIPMDLPAWAIVSVLIADSPMVLPSPQESVNWTMDQYVSWCDEHSELEILAFLSTLMSSYNAAVVSRNETTYVPHYPMIMKILQDAMKR